MELKKVTRLAMLLSLSIVLSLIECLIPLFNGAIPGLKLGLANTVILVVIYLYSYRDALYLSLMRVIIVSILRTGLFSITFWFSLGGALLSITMMSIAHKFKKLSIIGVSIIGAVFHSIGQIIVAMIILNTNSMLLYLPWLLLFSIPTGITVGIISKQILTYLEKHKI
jgi:heptaprenyl diphosphate synthase